jgi:hypothetical protein
MCFDFAAAKEVHKLVPVLKHKAAPFIRFMFCLKYEFSDLQLHCFFGVVKL